MAGRVRSFALAGLALVGAGACSNSASKSDAPVLTFGIQCTECTPEAPGDGPYRFFAASRKDELVYLVPGKFDARLEWVKAAKAESGASALVVRFQVSDGRRFEEFTGQNVDRPLAILLGDAVLSVAIINEPLPASASLTLGTFTPAESDELRRKLSR